MSVKRARLPGSWSWALTFRPMRRSNPAGDGGQVGGADLPTHEGVQEVVPECLVPSAAAPQGPTEGGLKHLAQPILAVVAGLVAEAYEAAGIRAAGEAAEPEHVRKAEKDLAVAFPQAERHGQVHEREPDGLLRPCGRDLDHEIEAERDAVGRRVRAAAPYLPQGRQRDTGSALRTSCVCLRIPASCASRLAGCQASVPAHAAARAILNAHYRDLGPSQ